MARLFEFSHWRRKAHPRAWANPHLEALEARLAPAGQVCPWVGLAMDDKWSSPANWQNQLVPQDGDIAVFNAAGPQANKDSVVDAAFNANLADLQMLAPYTGTLKVEHDLFVTGQALLQSGSVTVAQAIRMNAQRVQFDGVALDGDGRLVIEQQPGGVGQPGMLVSAPTSIDVMNVDLGATTSSNIASNFTFQDTRVVRYEY